jgi:hypothetical protein
MYMLATIMMKVITKMIKNLHKDTKKKKIFLIKDFFTCKSGHL